MLWRVQQYVESNDSLYDNYKKLTEPYYKCEISFDKGVVETSLVEVKKMMGDLYE